MVRDNSVLLIPKRPTVQGIDARIFVLRFYACMLVYVHLCICLCARAHFFTRPCFCVCVHTVCVSMLARFLCVCARARQNAPALVFMFVRLHAFVFTSSRICLLGLVPDRALTSMLRQRR